MPAPLTRALTITRRTITETMDDDGLGLAAQLAYYFFLALFPAILFILAIASFFSLGDLTAGVVRQLGTVVPPSAMSIVQDQLQRIADRDQSGLLTIGFLGALWSTSTALVSIISALNRAYDVDESRSWLHVRVLGILLTLVLASAVIGASVLVVGSSLASELGLGSLGLDSEVLSWLIGLAMVFAGLTVVYRFAADVDQGWSWSWPGALLATTLWLGASLAFRYYVANFSSYTESYGAVGGVIVMLLWLYLLGLAIVAGGELNSEVEFASTRSDSKKPGDRRAGANASHGAGPDRQDAQMPARAGAGKGSHLMIPSDEVSRLREQAAATRARIDRAAAKAADQIRDSARPSRFVARHPTLAAGASAALVASATGGWWWRRRQRPRDGAITAGPTGPVDVVTRAESERRFVDRVLKMTRYAGLALAVASAFSQTDGKAAPARKGAA
ncbi:MAG: YihY/virulence factor BrkB family protein [Vicinamibacterales bacterium]